MSHYLTEPIDVNNVGGVGSTEVTQGEHFTTANNLLNETLSAYILRAYPSAVIANITSATIINNSAGAVTLTSAAGPASVAIGGTMKLGNGSKKLNNLASISFGAVNSFTVTWSEDNA